MFNWLLGLKCPDCGGRFKEEEQYCPHCGANLDAASRGISKEKARQYLRKAQMAYDRGTRLQAQAALSNCDLAIQYDPDLAAAHNLRGLILDDMGQSDEAIHAYREAIRLNPNFEEARENLEDAERERHTISPEARRSPPSDAKWLKVILITVGILAGITAIAVSLGGLYLLYRVGREVLGPQATLTFVPDDSQISAVTPDDLETTARLLTERARFLGYPRVSFAVSPDSKIVGKVPGTEDPQALAKRIAAIGLLEFVDFGKTPVFEGTTVRTDWEHKYLRQAEGPTWHTVMTGDEIAAVYIGVDVNGSPAIDFVLTPDGSETLYQYTSENIGSYLGIVLDKVVISIPKVQAAIPDGQGQISGDFTEETAEELAMFLKMTPLPIPLKLEQEVKSGE